MRFSWAKVVVSLTLAVWYFALPAHGFSGFGDIAGHVLYPLGHANVFHLAANVLCLWMIPCELHLTSAFILSVLCSFLPCFVSEVTVGFSGVLFSMVAMSWGSVHRFRDMFWRNKWFLIIPVFIPHVNALLHVYCMIAGYVWGRYTDIGKGDWL